MTMKQILYEKASKYFRLTWVFCIGIIFMCGMLFPLMPKQVSEADYQTYLNIATEIYNGKENDEDSVIVVEKNGGTITVYNKEEPLSESITFTFGEEGNISHIKRGQMNPYALFTLPKTFIFLFLISIPIALCITCLLIVATWIKERL